MTVRYKLSTYPERAGGCAHLPVGLDRAAGSIAARSFSAESPVIAGKTTERGHSRIYGPARVSPLFGGPSTRVLFGKGVARAECLERRMDHLSAAHERCSDGRKVPTAAIREGVTKCPALSPFGMVPDHVAKIGACEHATRPAARCGLVARLSVRVLAGASCPGSF